MDDLTFCDECGGKLVSGSGSCPSCGSNEPVGGDGFGFASEFPGSGGIGFGPEAPGNVEGAAGPGRLVDPLDLPAVPILAAAGANPRGRRVSRWMVSLVAGASLAVAVIVLAVTGAFVGPSSASSAPSGGSPSPTPPTFSSASGQNGQSPTDSSTQASQTNPGAGNTSGGSKQAAPTQRTPTSSAGSGPTSGDASGSNGSGSGGSGNRGSSTPSTKPTPGVKWTGAPPGGHTCGDACAVTSFSPPATTATTSPPAPSTWTETVGGFTHTWTNYLNAGGTEGASIANGQSVQIACRLTGLTVQDGNDWWYEIASSPWNSAYFASADAFYNDGATSGSLHGTPFVDRNVRVC